MAVTFTCIMQESWKVVEEDLPSYISDKIDKLIQRQPEIRGVHVTFHKNESVRTCVYRYSCVYGYSLDFFMDVTA